MFQREDSVEPMHNVDIGFLDLSIVNRTQRELQLFRIFSTSLGEDSGNYNVINLDAAW